jgi:hypothetical protein
MNTREVEPIVNGIPTSDGVKPLRVLTHLL